jgi:hypothetical protein
MIRSLRHLRLMIKGLGKERMYKRSTTAVVAEDEGEALPDMTPIGNNHPTEERERAACLPALPSPPSNLRHPVTPKV